MGKVRGNWVKQKTTTGPSKDPWICNSGWGMGRYGAHTVQLLWEMKHEFPALPFLSRVRIKVWPHLVFPFLSSSPSKLKALPNFKQSVKEESSRTTKGKMLPRVSDAVPAPESQPQVYPPTSGGRHTCQPGVGI